MSTMSSTSSVPTLSTSMSISTLSNATLSTSTLPTTVNTLSTSTLSAESWEKAHYLSLTLWDIDREFQKSHEAYQQWLSKNRPKKSKWRRFRSAKFSDSVGKVLGLGRQIREALENGIEAFGSKFEQGDSKPAPTEAWRWALTFDSNKQYHSLRTAATRAARNTRPPRRLRALSLFHYDTTGFASQRRKRGPTYLPLCITRAVCPFTRVTVNSPVPSTSSLLGQFLSFRYATTTRSQIEEEQFHYIQSPPPRPPR